MDLINNSQITHRRFFLFPIAGLRIHSFFIILKYLKCPTQKRMLPDHYFQLCRLIRLSFCAEN